MDSPSSSTGPQPIVNSRPGGRRRSILSDFLSDSLPQPSSFLSTSPGIAREILTQDIAECSSSDDDDEQAAASDAESASGPADAKLAFHPNGIVWGAGCSLVPTHSRDRPVPNPHEVEESLHAELSLLRDNAILPPKHRRPRTTNAFARLYRRNFSTKVRDHEGPIVPDVAVETTPMLREIPPTPGPEEIERRFEFAVAHHEIRTTWQREAKTLIQYSTPLIATFLMHYSVTIGSVLTVGRLGLVELAAVNLATMTASITCYVPVQGLATCLDTLCAQAYGSGHKHLVGLQAQRMTWLLWILMVPIALLWWFSEPILAALVPSKETASLAATFLRVLIAGMPGVAMLESGKRFVQSQGLFKATTYALMMGAPLSFLQNWLFVFKFGWGFVGAAAAMAITQNLLPLLLVLYVWLVDGSRCWNGFSRKALRNWGPMIKLALPGMIMIEAQFSVLEVLTLCAGQFGTSQLAAQSILVTVTSTSFNIPFPLAIATSTRVANLIGADLSQAAKVTAKVSIIAACMVGCFNLLLFTTFRDLLPRIFTDDVEVIRIASQALLVCGVMQVFDAIAAVAHGLLRGIGQQAIGSYANLFSYYLVALPISLSTAFALGWRLTGLWAGITVGLLCVSVIELAYLHQTDWEVAAAQAADRLRSEDVAEVKLRRHSHSSYHMEV
ncbi:MATE efflux family protein [Parathielavia hyrcaniae]|uniref:MATE efflux family protein n=1 Tax=Parathielavia hyrcaniae TaxID=113614 RepID=A0AAN6PR00_9PEZI|nr:MATE efflux family protein [Parathielavia hyrcaniae]